MIHCNHCEHDNDDLSVDEDGDYVCEECGHVIELPTEDDVIHSCVQCGHDNRNLERDEDGDYVCQECGHVIPEDNALMVPEVRMNARLVDLLRDTVSESLTSDSLLLVCVLYLCSS